MALMEIAINKGNIVRTLHWRASKMLVSGAVGLAAKLGLGRKSRGQEC